MKPFTIRVRLSTYRDNWHMSLPVVARLVGSKPPAIGHGRTVNEALRDLATCPSLSREWDHASRGYEPPQSYDDRQLAAVKRPCSICGRVFHFTNSTSTTCANCV